MKRETVKKANDLLQKIESIEKDIDGITSNGMTITTTVPQNEFREIRLSDKEEQKVIHFLILILQEKISELEKELNELTDEEDLCINAQ